MECWQSIGAEINLIGSLKMGLLCKHLDIDFHIYTPTLEVAQSFDAIAKLANNPKIIHIEYRNLLEEEDQCLEWHALYQDEQLWQIDMIHIVQGSKYVGHFGRVAERDEQRPRLLYISNSTNVLIADVHLVNAHFWTTHIYKCQHVKYLNCYIYSPAAPVKAPSTDAIDIDVCTDVLVKNCYLEVNDDAVVLKGGKGPWADTAVENGSNERILVEDCVYGFCHGCLTCGSESVHNRNILIRRIKVHSGYNLLWLKMRPDTPQHYEYITVEEVEGKIVNFININPWTQFFDLKGREDIPLSTADHVVVSNCKCECNIYFNVKKNEEQYRLSDFVFENLEIKAAKNGFVQDAVENMIVKNVKVEE